MGPGVVVGVLGRRNQFPSRAWVFSLLPFDVASEQEKRVNGRSDGSRSRRLTRDGMTSKRQQPGGGRQQGSRKIIWIQIGIICRTATGIGNGQTKPSSRNAGGQRLVPTH